jgi:hypothetical protein
MKLPLNLLLLILILLSLLSGLQKVFGLSAWPPTWQAPRRLQLPGYQAKLIASHDGATGREFSTGVMRQFRLHSLDHTPEIIDLTIVPVNSINPDKMSLSRITADRPELALKKPQLLAHRPPGQAADQEDHLAMAKAGAATLLQTCMMRSGVAGYSQTTLGDELTRQNLRRFDDNSLHKFLDYASRFLALQPITPSECLLVQLKTTTAATDQQSLLNAWDALRPLLLQGNSGQPDRR